MKTDKHVTSLAKGAVVAQQIPCHPNGIRQTRHEKLPSIKLTEIGRLQAKCVLTSWLSLKPAHISCSHPISPLLNRRPVDSPIRLTVSLFTVAYTYRPPSSGITDKSLQHSFLQGKYYLVSRCGREGANRRHSLAEAATELCGDVLPSAYPDYLKRERPCVKISTELSFQASPAVVRKYRLSSSDACLQSLTDASSFSNTRCFFVFINAILHLGLCKLACVRRGCSWTKALTRD